LTREGYAICVVFLKLFERIYAPLTTGLLQSVAGDSNTATSATHSTGLPLSARADDLDKLLSLIGPKVGA
jgi:hypothetical protein